MRIEGHKIVGGEFAEAHSYGGEMTPSLIILHDTAGRLERGSSVNWFKSDECGTSAHVVVERDGVITQMVPFNRKAWHAGASEFKGKANCNAFSIGIEIVNPGALDKDGRAWFHKKTDKGFSGARRVKTAEHGDGYWLDYTPEQIDAVTNLCKALALAYPDIEDVSAHYIVSPRRKVDVGPLFPLDDVRRATLAVRADGTADVVEPVAATMESVGFLSSMSFAKLNDLADQGSRVGGWLRSIKRYFWGTTTVGSGGVALLANAENSTASAFSQIVRDHPFVTVGVAGAAMAALFYVAVKLIEKYILTAVRDGRYKPRGG